MGKVNPQEQSGVREVLSPHGEKHSTAGKTSGRDCVAPPQAKAPVDPGEQPNSLVLEQGHWGEAWYQRHVAICHNPLDPAAAQLCKLFLGRADTQPQSLGMGSSTVPQTFLGVASTQPFFSGTLP